MRGSFLLCFFAMVISCLASTGASACGESMFRVGKGVHYRAYSAPIPGTVLVYARTNEERAVAERLQEAGHEVLVVDSDLDLAMKLHDHAFDVIVAPASNNSSASGRPTIFEAPTITACCPLGSAPIYSSSFMIP